MATSHIDPYRLGQQVKVPSKNPFLIITHQLQNLFLSEIITLYVLYYYNSYEFSDEKLKNVGLFDLNPKK